MTLYYYAIFAAFMLIMPCLLFINAIVSYYGSYNSGDKQDSVIKVKRSKVF